MPIQHAIWKIGAKLEPLTASKLASEKSLEDMIVQCPAILPGEWMLIGRQEKTQFGGIIDLLVIAPDKSLVLIELKRDKTPRGIVARSLDYACSGVHNSGSGIGMEILSPPFAAATSFPPIKIITRPRTASLSG